MGLGKPSCVPNMKSLASAVAEILKGYPKFWGAPLAQGHTFFVLVGFDDETWQTLTKVLDIR